MGMMEDIIEDILKEGKWETRLIMKKLHPKVNLVGKNTKRKSNYMIVDYQIDPPELSYFIVTAKTPEKQNIKKMEKKIEEIKRIVKRFLRLSFFLPNIWIKTGIDCKSVKMKGGYVLECHAKIAMDKRYFIQEYGKKKEVKK